MTKILRLTPLPLAFGLAYFPSVQYHVLFIDGPDTEFYGLPLPWNSRFIAGSIAKDVYVLPFVIDVIFFGIVAWWLWRSLSAKVIGLRPVARRSILIGIWAYGLFSFSALLLAALAYDLLPSTWYYLPLDKVLEVRLHGSV